MIDNHVNISKSPKFHVKKYLLKNRQKFFGKIVLDIPAGNGVTTEILVEMGCKVYPFDLFPEYFRLEGLTCERANLLDKIPVNDSFADFIICQEGIEHMTDQMKVLKEFNRILKKEGELILTTPSYSNLKAKISYLLFETEYFNKLMPPNELQSIWFADKNISDEIYYGHIFLAGIQKLRVLAKLAGFKIEKINFMRINKTSLILFPLFYPLICLSSFLTYKKSIRKNSDIPKEIKKKVFWEQLKINLNPKTLIDEHLFIVFKKEIELDDIYFQLNSNFKKLSDIT